MLLRYSEKREEKKEFSKDGLLGVEGIDSNVLRELLKPFVSNNFKKGGEITKSRFYEDGFSGGADASFRRSVLAELLSLPKTLTAKALLEAINLLVTEEEYNEAVKRINNEQ